MRSSALAKLAKALRDASEAVAELANDNGDTAPEEPPSKPAPRITQLDRARVRKILRARGVVV